MFKNLEVEMFRRGMTTAQLAEKVGICESSMRNKLKGRKEFKLSEFRRVLAVFPDAKWDYLFADEESRPDSA